MMRFFFIGLSVFLIIHRASTQEIIMQELAMLDQVSGYQVESETLLSMNDLGVEFGYVLYQTDIVLEVSDALLEVDNIRDYGVVYLNEDLQGVLTDSNKRLTLSVGEGKYTLRIYVENIGRITYGPEILDNSKGLFGNIYIDGENIEGWEMTELIVRKAKLENLKFSHETYVCLPGFHKAYFEIKEIKDLYLDVSGWGMGEVWINGQYIGSYWEEEKQQSIQTPASILKKGKNELVVFELKNNQQKSLKISDVPVFK